MEKKTTRVSLDTQLKRLEIAEKEKELVNMERRINNVSRGIIIDQVRALTSLLETRVVVSSPIPSQPGEWVNAFDEDDQIKIKAKIMRLINTF